MENFPMKLILTFALVLCSLLMSMPALAALNNDNNPHSHCVSLDSPSADAVSLGGAVHSGKSWVATKVYLLNAANIAASNTDYVLLQLKKGATNVATLDTRSSGNGAVTANAVKALTLVSSETTMAAGSVLSVNYDETDAATNVALTGAMLCAEYTVK